MTSANPAPRIPGTPDPWWRDGALRAIEPSPIARGIIYGIAFSLPLHALVIGLALLVWWAAA